MNQWELFAIWRLNRDEECVDRRLLQVTSKKTDACHFQICANSQTQNPSTEKEVGSAKERRSLQHCSHL